jgi:hypothetical protein
MGEIVVGLTIESIPGLVKSAWKDREGWFMALIEERT